MLIWEKEVDTLDNIVPKKVMMFCPHCGYKIIALKSADGALRIQCKKCKTVIFSIAKNRGLDIKTSNV